MHFSNPHPPFVPTRGVNNLLTSSPLGYIYREKEAFEIMGHTHTHTLTHTHTHTHFHTYSYTMGVGSTKGCKQCNIKGGLHPRGSGYIYIIYTERV